MMTFTPTRFASALVGLFLAVTALAGGIDLQPAASALVSEYEALEARIDACPDGDCDDRPDIEADLEALDLDLADLQIERDALEPCSDCQELDALLDDAERLSSSASEETGNWEDN